MPAVPDPEAVFLAKACSDLVAARRLAVHEDVDDESVGFHCQQAVEKALKAVLVQRGVPFRYGHDLQRLINQLVDDGLVVPGSVTASVWLTPFATDLRYEALPADAGVFDRSKGIQTAADVIAWAESRRPAP